MKRNLFILFLTGATWGSFLDGLHTHSGTTAYPHPIFLQMAWWTPPVFGMAAFFMGLPYVLFPRFATRGDVVISRRDGLVGLLLFSVLYFVSGFLPGGNSIKNIVVPLGALLLWAFLNRTLQGLGLAVLTGIAGAIAEIVMIRGGLFAHLWPDFYGIPAWLPFLYFGASVTMGNLGRALSKD